MRYIDATIKTDSSRCYGGRSAEDLTHDFLIQLLEGKLLKRFDRREGRFRTYLLVVVKHFLSDVRRQESAAKRGGKIVQVPIQDDIPQTTD